MKRTIFSLSVLFFISILNAQTPQAFKYQAVVRDNTGSLLIEQSVNFQIDILKGAVDGSIIYSETHTASTNSHGLVNLEVGSGTTTDDFSEIDWGTGPYFSKIWVNGEEMGTSQLLSVPYALHAKTAETISGSEIKNLADPVDDQDAATKAYVDRQITNPGIRIQAEVDSVLCFGEYSGAIDLTINGGTPPYAFEWDDGSSTEDIADLTHGKYQVYVEDNNGLTAFRHFTLHAPSKILISHQTTFSTGVIDITVTGGTAPYSFLWSNGSADEDLTGISQGVYTVEVTDILGCSVSKEIEMIKESIILAQYLESGASPASLETVASLITASDLHALNTIGGAYIIDVRNATDYSTLGHIEGAVNVVMSDLISHLDATDVSGYDRIAIVDYTGQAALYINALTRLAGYEVSSLKWGMASWNSTFAGNWNANVSNVYESQFETTGYSKGPTGQYPEITTGFNTEAEILEARIDAVLAEGFGTAAISASTLFGDLDNYYIINHMPKDRYDLGHIPGAIQYTPNQDLYTTAFLNTLPTDKTVVVYDYTGQVSAAIVTYLRILGYDAKSLKFGLNGMVYDWSVNNGLPYWSDIQIAEYDYVTE